MDYENVSHQQIMLAQNLENDFRAVNLARLVHQNMAPGNALDVGCGTGSLVLYLLKHDIDIHGIDIDNNSIEILKKNLLAKDYDPSRVSTKTIFDLAQQNFTTDNLISIDCLEHVKNDKEMFKAFFHCTKPGGKIIIIVPALMSLFSEWDKKIGHYRRYEKDTLAALIKGYPVKIERLRYWSFIGAAATFTTQKILKRNVDESFRFGPLTLRKKLLRTILNNWFRYIENPISPPIGLSLVLTLTRSK